MVNKYVDRLASEWKTRGIFSKGLDKLSNYFDGIYCTNGVKDLDDIDIELGEPSSQRQINFLNDKVKQLNIY